jgi:hypothetical protein
VQVLAPNYKQHFFAAKGCKVCCSLAELCVECLCLNLFVWRENDVYETFKGDASYNSLGTSGKAAYNKFGFRCLNK